MRNASIWAVSLGLSLFLASCSSMKLASSQGEVKTPKGSSKAIEVYTFTVEKSADKVIEIDEVKLVNTETQWSQQVGYTLKNEGGKESILSTKGYSTFTIVCKNPNSTGSEVQANKAIVTYHHPEKGKKNMEFEIGKSSK